jgi:hypothetical protein
MFIDLKRIVLVFNLYASEGDGYIRITPPGQPMQYYNFPEDFNQLYFLFFRNTFLGYCVFWPVGGGHPDWELEIRGMGTLIGIG